jgi:hypothetical protein
MSSKDEKIVINLSKDEALILFDWLARVNERGTVETDDIEKQLLCNVEADLERILVEPFAENYFELITLAKARVRGQS